MSSVYQGNQQGTVVDFAGGSISMPSAYEERIHDAAPEELPILLGELATLHALVWKKLMQAAGDIAPANDAALLSIPQVAERLNLPESRVYELARRRDGFPVIKIGKYIRVHPVALQEWLDRQSSRDVDK
jgi:excisionase family DNA binding protein